jgi:hypothetical protein
MRRFVRWDLSASFDVALPMAAKRAHQSPRTSTSIGTLLDSTPASEFEPPARVTQKTSQDTDPPYGGKQLAPHPGDAKSRLKVRRSSGFSVLTVIDSALLVFPSPLADGIAARLSDDHRAMSTQVTIRWASRRGARGGAGRMAIGARHQRRVQLDGHRVKRSRARRLGDVGRGAVPVRW